MPPDFSREGQRHKDTHALRFGREGIARAGGVEKAIRFGQPLSACPSAMDGMRRDAGRVHFPRVSVSSPGAERCRVLGHGAIQGALTAMRVFWSASRRVVALRFSENGSIREMPPYFTGRGIGKGYTCVAFRQGGHSARQRGGEGDKVWAALSACPSAMDGMRFMVAAGGHAQGCG